MGGWGSPIDPDGFANAIRAISKCGLPIYITECGAAE